MSHKTRVAILDDHQSIVDGYLYRLRQTPEIEVVATAAYGEELEPMLAGHAVDVLLLDINVPTAPANRNPYPVLHVIPNLLEAYPDLNVLAISMYNQRTLIKTVMDAGASGYILKDDREAIGALGAVVRSVTQGGIYLSQEAYQELMRKPPLDLTLTSRQLEVLSLCAAYPDATAGELARRLGVKTSTIRNLLSSVYLRLGVQSRTAAVAKARRTSLITPLDQYVEP